MTLTFTPLVGQESLRELECKAQALGYLGLSNENKYKENVIERAEGFRVDQLALDIVAKIKPAL